MEVRESAAEETGAGETKLDLFSDPGSAAEGRRWGMEHLGVLIKEDKGYVCGNWTKPMLFERGYKPSLPCGLWGPVSLTPWSSMCAVSPCI